MVALLSDINIIVSGFMGTGKSVVGQAVAQRLGLDFVDMDEVLEERFGQAIANIFATRGEAYFREQEHLLAVELASLDRANGTGNGKVKGRVIATGGGALVADRNREALAASGIIFNLSCEPAEILARLRAQDGGIDVRPMLRGEDRMARIVTLLKEREPAYAHADFQIDTTSLSVDQVAERIVDLCRQRGYCADTFRVTHPTGSYDVWYGNRLSQRAGEILRHSPGFESGEGTVVIVSNRNVFRHHGPALVASLRAAQFNVHTVNMPDGEEHKTLRTVRRLYDRFLDLKLDRTSTIIALGGGVTGDVAGFAAATYMRGLPLIQIPTTLLAQVDSSIGGKTGVDLPRGKNLVGAFYSPRLVITDPGVLATLPPEQVRSGLAEVVKAGVIRSPHLFEDLERSGADWLDPAIREAVKIKAEVVTEDPFERGIRAILNYGHTFGHALEAASNFGVPHGEAVGIGMVVAAKVAVKIGLCSTDVEARIANLLRKLGLPTTSAAAAPAVILAGMGTDKKRQQGKLRYVLPRRIGEVIVTADVPESAIVEALGEVFPG